MYAFGRKLHRLPGYGNLKGMRMFLAVLVFLTTAAHALTLSNTCNQNIWVANSGVGQIVTADDRVYIAGNFTQVGPYTGNGVPIDLSTGRPVAVFPKTSGTVNTVCADGNGGWFVGGQFTEIGGVARSNIAHVLSDGTVDSAWNADAKDPPLSLYAFVYAIALSGNTMYVGGYFTSIGGMAMNCLAALDATTGYPTGWTPVWATNGYVYSIEVSGTTVYVGTAGGVTALDATTADTLAGNRVVANGIVLAIGVRGRTVYVGGDFTYVGGQPRTGIAAFDAATGYPISWNPNSNGSVCCLTFNGTTIYAGGEFTHIGGYDRNNIAALDSATGNATAWNPDANGANDTFFCGHPVVKSIVVNGNTVYAGGLFTSIGGQGRCCIAAIDAASGAATAWDPHAGGVVSCLAVGSTKIYAGGSVCSIGGKSRNCIASLDAATGTATDWDPSADGIINCMAVSGGTVYVIGDFRNIGGQARHGLAALDATTGNTTAWDPNANQSVYSIATSRGTVYVGGLFTFVGSEFRNGIAALDSATGNATSWNPSAGGIVYPTVTSLAVGGNTIYAAGRFYSIGGQSRHLLAALDATTGNATAWNPNPDTTVQALAMSGATVYAGGIFKLIGGQSRHHLAALDASTGIATAWDPNPNDYLSLSWGIERLATSAATVYAAGDFTNIGGENRNWFAALDSATGKATPWNPNPDAAVASIAVSGAKVYLGGNFTSIHGIVHPYLAQFDTSSSVSRIRSPGISPLRRAFNLSVSARTGRITYTLPQSQHVSLRLYNVNGRLQCELVNKQQPAGRYAVELSNRALAAGAHLVLLETGDHHEEKLIILTK